MGKDLVSWSFVLVLHVSSLPKFSLSRPGTNVFTFSGKAFAIQTHFSLPTLGNVSVDCKEYFCVYGYVCKCVNA